MWLTFERNFSIDDRTNARKLGLRVIARDNYDNSEVGSETISGVKVTGYSETILRNHYFTYNFKKITNFLHELVISDPSKRLDKNMRVVIEYYHLPEGALNKPQKYQEETAITVPQQYRIVDR